MPYAVIMAGGRGERFWPRSRMSFPKQFLNLLGDKSMLQMTVERVEDLVGINNVYVVAGDDFRELVINQLPRLPENNIIIEPFGRDTAAAVGLASVVLGRQDPGEVMIVLPADHFINDVARFQEVLEGAMGAARRGDEIVTLGITPHRPETGYGYIRRGEVLDTFNGIPAFRVESFLEKPDYHKALELINSENYLWNSGMFAWRVDLIIKLIDKYTPRLADGLKSIGQALGSMRYSEVLMEVYEALPKISVDYGILEKADRVLVMPGDFGWDDIGSWVALERYSGKDECGNTLEGDGVFLDTRDTYVYSPGKTVALIGLEGLIVVNDQDTLLICRRDRAQDIKKAVEALREKGLKKVL